MADEKKLVEEITSMDVDFTQWYTDVVRKAELMEYSSVKGFMILKPNGYAIWENIQRQLDDRFKDNDVENVYMPMLIPESLLQKEKLQKVTPVTTALAPWNTGRGVKAARMGDTP